MAFKRHNTKAYARRIAKESGLTIKQVHAVLSFGMRNIVRMIECKEDVRLPVIGRLYIDKPHRRNPKKKPRT